MPHHHRRAPMRGVVFLGDRKLELRDFPDPTPGPGEVVIAIKASGMCGSDLHPYRAVGNAAAALGLGGAGERVLAVDVAPERLKLARDFGADEVIDPRAVDPVRALRDLTHGEGVEAAVDCSGNPDARVAAVQSACTWGRVAFVGEGNTTT